MLTKILFTFVVIVGVAIFYRQKAEKENAARTQKNQDVQAEASLQPRTLAYILIAVLVAISMGVFAFSWQRDNQIVNIRVTAESGNTVTYQAYQKNIKGRSFVSLSGSQITLGESDRVEMITQ
ncbi:MAG: hypothetical protein KTR18_13380 [Acidiferrobacterales bacterium]|nr:hypothetical protein [Acidiferrobacterales bacterium]